MVTAHTAHQIRQNKIKNRRVSETNGEIYEYKGIFHQDHLPATVGLFGFIVAFSLFSLQMALLPFTTTVNQSREVEQLPAEPELETTLYTGSRVDLGLYPSTPEDAYRNAGETISVNLDVNPNGQLVNGVDLLLKFDPAQLTLTQASIQANNYPYLTPIPSLEEAVTKATNGYFQTSLLQDISVPGFSNNGTLLKLTFTRKTTTATDISFVTTPTQINGYTYSTIVAIDQTAENGLGLTDNLGLQAFVCAEGAARCDVNAVQPRLVCHSNQWVAEACDAGFQCVGDGVCQAIPGWCPTNGTTQCAGGLLQTCVANRWDAGTQCTEGNECLDGATQCTAIPNWCNPVNAPSKCENGQLVTCGTDFRWAQPVFCSAGQQCVAGSSQCTDIPNWCPVNGAKRCGTNGTPEACVNNLWQTQQACAQSESCVGDGQCQADFDFNNDGVLNILDYREFRLRFIARDITIDYNKDGTVNILDYAMFKNAYNSQQVQP